MKLEIMSSEFKIAVGKYEFVAKNDDYTSFRNFTNYAKRMLESMSTSFETYKFEEDFLQYVEMYPLKGNKYFTKEQMKQIRLAIYYTKNNAWAESGIMNKEDLAKKEKEMMAENMPKEEEETPLTTEKEEQNVSRETTPAPKKYYKAFISNPNKKYLGDFRGNHKYYNGGQFSSKKGFCVCDDPKLCVGFMECHLEEGETLEIYEVQALNQQPSNTETELVFKTITLVRRLIQGKDY